MMVTGVPLTFRADNDSEYSNGLFVDFCNSFDICREIEASYSSRENGVIESEISRAFRARHTASLGVDNYTRMVAATRSGAVKR